jgi:LmbE family N-acetylglucosaminyl deacetylase
VVVSPHLDDAVLSVGATIARRVAAGHAVTIVTVCSAVDDQGRRDDDRRAAAIVGADTVHLDIDDAPRRGHQVSWAGLCEVEDDHTVVEHMARRLSAVVASADEVWAPLGCGGHVDHRATLQALLRTRADISLYEERPYARQQGRVAAAWCRLNAVVDDHDHIGPLQDDPDEWDDVVPFLTRVKASPVAAIPAPWSLRFAGRRWRRLACIVGPDERKLRQRALEAYQGEWAQFADPHLAKGWPITDRAEYLWSRCDP